MTFSHCSLVMGREIQLFFSVYAGPDWAPCEVLVERTWRFKALAVIWERDALFSFACKHQVAQVLIFAGSLGYDLNLI